MGWAVGKLMNKMCLPACFCFKYSWCLEDENMWSNQEINFCLHFVLQSSRKTVKARENFWNVYCFATNQKRAETGKDNCQTTAKKPACIESRRD